MQPIETAKGECKSAQRATFSASIHESLLRDELLDTIDERYEEDEDSFGIFSTTKLRISGSISSSLNQSENTTNASNLL